MKVEEAAQQVGEAVAHLPVTPHEGNALLFRFAGEYARDASAGLLWAEFVKLRDEYYQAAKQAYEQAYVPKPEPEPVPISRLGLTIPACHPGKPQPEPMPRPVPQMSPEPVQRMPLAFSLADADANS